MLFFFCFYLIFFCNSVSPSRRTLHDSALIPYLLLILFEKFSCIYTSISPNFLIGVFPSLQLLRVIDSLADSVIRFDSCTGFNPRRNFHLKWCCTERIYFRDIPLAVLQLDVETFVVHHQLKNISWSAFSDATEIMLHTDCFRPITGRSFTAKRLQSNLLIGYRPKETLVGCVRCLGRKLSPWIIATSSLPFIPWTHRSFFRGSRSLSTKSCYEIMV